MRRKPYTERGISRVPCARCSKPSRFQWQVCADNRQYRTVCEDCDVELNKRVLRFFFKDEATERIKAYRDKVLRG